MIEFILASGNKHKAEEFSELFDPSVIRVIPASEKLDVVEDGLSYFENAGKKAEAYYKKFNRPVLSDDSGLNVEALPEELGIHSARFGGEGLSDKDRALLLLEKLEGASSRRAYFSCVLCMYINPEEIFYFEGRMSGTIGHAYRGSTGFGYDPIFIPEEKLEEGLTIAELKEWKQLHSHRALASGLAQRFLSQRK